MPKAIVPVLAMLPMLAAGWARADELRVPPGMMLCRSAEAVAEAAHAGCWRAAGGQVIDRISPVVTWSQLVVRSTNGQETMTVYARKSDTDEIERKALSSGAVNSDRPNADVQN